jgi:ribosomal protein L16 Arg81 hydroxylase
MWLPGFRDQNDVAVPSDDVVVSAWIGNRSRISAHFDFPDNVACVVAGRRRFTLFPPDQIKNLYIGPVDLTPAGQAISLVDFANPDFDRFPKFEKALQSACVYELEPGDAIFIPSMWWHHVESLSSFNMLVNYWWCSTPAIMGAPMDALMHAILSIREIPQPQRDIWKALFDHYVFSADESVYEHIPEQGRGCLAPMDNASAAKLRTEINNKLNR